MVPNAQRRHTGRTNSGEGHHMALVSDSGVEELRAGFSGVVVLPGDADYDLARWVWNGDIDRHPAVIARCLSASDVAAAIAFGRRQGMGGSVRGGGHNFAGHAVVEGGLMIDLSPLKQAAADVAGHRV